MLRHIIARSPVAVGSIAMLSLVPLFAWDVAPTGFPSRSHDLLGAIPLFAIAASYLAQQLVQRPSRLAWLRATIVIAAFVAWAANQYWSEHPLATLWNDIAIALFVIDIFLSVASAPGPAVAGTPGDAAENAKTADAEPAPVPTTDGAS
jgi:hypothetical protein